MDLYARRSVCLFCAFFIIAILFFSGIELSADPLHVLLLGKTRSGAITSINKRFQADLPVTQEVTLRVEKVNGSTVKIHLSWSKTSWGNGKPGSGEFYARLSQENGTVRLSCETGNRNWLFTFQPDGTVNCQMMIPDKRIFRYGDLR